MMYYDDWGMLPREPRNPKEELGATIILVILILVMAWLLGCISAPSVTSAEAPFALALVPAFAFPGADVRLTCHVPESLGRGVIRLALEDAAVTGPKRIEHIQETLLVQHVECGTWKATCRVVTEEGEQYAERVLEVKGGMCDAEPAR